jgi:hypothetical protein
VADAAAREREGMSHTTLSTPPLVGPPTARRASWLAPVTAALASGGAVALGITAWRDPASIALTASDGPIAASLLPPLVVAAVTTLAGAAGLLAVLAHLARPRRRPRGELVAVLAADVVVLGFGLGSVSSIALAGYLVALAMPVVLVLLVIQAVRRYRRLRWVALTATASFVAWGLVSAALRPESLGRLGSGLVTGFGSAGPRVVVAVVSTAAVVSFGLLLLEELRGTERWQRAGAFVVRHRTAWTVVAACCALPYGLVRMTWFTPWAVLGQGDQLTSEIRLWGLLLGSGSILGFILTTGLVRPWSERFPRWMPALAGRPVPVAAAAVPGGVVAAVLCTAALPMLHDLSFTEGGSGLGVSTLLEQVAMAVVFPFWLWGPMLALAVWGYVLHRSADRSCVPAAGRP